MSQRTGTTYSQIEAQSFRPVFVQTIAFTTSAAVTGILPLTADAGPAGTQVALWGPCGARGKLLILQADQDVYVRLIGAGTAQSSQTVTYSSSSGAQTIVVGGYTVSFTAGASDTLTAQAAIDAISADPVLSTFLFASKSSGVLTLKTRAMGIFNALTLAVTGTGATRGGATFASGTSAAAATSATNAIKIPAGSLLPMYCFASDLQLDVKGSTASGNLNVFLGF